MIEQTPLSKSIHVSDGEVQYDAACKRLLSQKSILAWILKECVEEYRDYSIDDIRDKYIEGNPQISTIPVAPDESNLPQIHGDTNEDKSPTEGTVYYDIRFRSIVPNSDGEMIGLIVNLEAQNKYNPGYPLVKRGIYYCSRMISAQYGTEFVGSAYGRIKKVYSVWVCMDPPNHRKNTITRYIITESNLVGAVKENKANYDLLSTIMICLGDVDPNSPKDVLKLLNVLLSNSLKEDAKKRILEDEFQIPMTVELTKEVNSMCNLSEGILEKGRIEGRAEGRELGALESNIVSIQNLMKNTGWSPEKAMDALNISPNIREEYYKRFPV